MAAVNGVVAALDANNNFYATVPLTVGVNIITATLATLAGATTTQSVAVGSDGVAPAIQISADRVDGIAPLTVNFSIEGTGAMAGNLSYSGGTAAVSFNGNIYTVTYPSPGTYPTTINASDSQGNAVTKSFVVVVQDAAQMDLKLMALWNGMNNALIAGDKASALSYLSINAQEKYGPVFDALQADYQSIISTWSAPARGNVSNTFGEYAVITTNDGAAQLFLIYFLQGADGVWRLDAM